MYTRIAVLNELLTQKELPAGDFVCIIAEVENGTAYHSGLLIAFERKLYIFDYTGQEIRHEEMANTHHPVILKRIENVQSQEIEAFISHCNQIKKIANPRYGHFYSGSYYDLTGKFVDISGSEEYMTCVGFCINVVKGFLEEEYFSFLEWDDSSVEDSETYLKNFIDRINTHRTDKVDESKFRKHLRRITPTEYTTSGFHKNLPILKTDIESNVELVRDCLSEKAKTFS